MKSKAKKENEESDKENYRENYENMFEATDIEADKVIYRKLYKILALEFHPDKAGGDGAEMKIINGLKELWGI